MDTKRIALFGAVCLSLSVGQTASAKDYAVDPHAGAGQELRFQQGIGTITSDKPNSQIWIKPAAKSFNKRMVFSVSAANKSNALAELDYGNVQATTDSGAPLEMVTMAKMQKEAKTKAGWTMFAVALAGGLQAASATSYSSGSVYTSRGSASFNVSTHDALASQLAVDRTASDLGQIQANLDAKLSDLDNNLLQRNTIDPGQSSGGFVIISKPPKEAKSVIIHVTFAGEVHDFEFALNR